MEGNKNLASYILAVVICDLNVEFCNRYIPKRLRTYDQMTQAARSGKPLQKASREEKIPREKLTVRLYLYWYNPLE